MRIRKGGLLHSSMLSRTASDPQLQPTTSHELHPIAPKTESQPSDPSDQPPFHLPSDHPPKILGCNKLTITNSNSSHKFEIKQKKDHRTRKAKSEEASGDDEEENGSGTRKRNIILGAAPVRETVVSTPLNSSQVDERWFDVDKKIPAMKRKGVDVENLSQETPMSEKAKKMRSKTSKKCSATILQQNGDQDKAGNDDRNSTNNNVNIVKKTNKRGGAIMEGSRCSRVNGRGWRCCQQTLVGYSLCEHHLGKGRLRSITNTKARAKMPTAAVPPTAPHNDITSNTTSDNQPAKKVLVSSSVVQPAQDHNKGTMLLDGSCYGYNEDKEEDEDEDDDDDYIDEEMKKPLVPRKKRMKVGMVKARSLSSLLNQTNNAVAVAVAADDN